MRLVSYKVDLEVDRTSSFLLGLDRLEIDSNSFHEGLNNRKLENDASWEARRTMARLRRDELKSQAR